MRTATAMPDIERVLTAAPVIPVVVIDRVQDAAPLAAALVAGGLPVIEVTLRTPAALGAIAAMAAVEGCVVGAGTVLNAHDVETARKAGARFIVSPGLSAEVVRAARSAELAVLPGVATASEVMRALDLGLRHLKFFPAEAAGGTAMLKSLAGPFPQVRFCPTGGIGPANARSYLAQPNVLCVGGSWMAPAAAQAEGDWGGITERAAEAAALTVSV